MAPKARSAKRRSTTDSQLSAPRRSAMLIEPTTSQKSTVISFRSPSSAAASARIRAARCRGTYELGSRPGPGGAIPPPPAGGSSAAHTLQ